MKDIYIESSHYKILDNIYIGNIWSPKNINTNENFTDVVSFIKLSDNTIKNITDNYNYYQYFIDNSNEKNIILEFNKMKDFLHNKLFVENGKILFICFCGRSCSVSIVLLILLEFYNYKFYDALTLLNSKINLQINHTYYNDIKNAYRN